MLDLVWWVVVLLGSLLVIALVMMAVARPMLNVALASVRFYMALMSENSSLGRRRGRNTWLMYVHLTKDRYEYLMHVCQGYNPFTGTAHSSWSEALEAVPYDHFVHADEHGVSIKPHFNIVASKDAAVTIGWPWFGYESVTPWYLTAALRDAAPRRNSGDQGGDENHTIPLKVVNDEFPLPLKDADRKELEKKVAEVRAGRSQPLTTDEVRSLMSLKPAETADGFPIECSITVDRITVEPFLFVTAADTLGDQLYELLNSALLMALADIEALAEVSKDAPPEEAKRMLLGKILTKLQEKAGVTAENQQRPFNEFLHPRRPDDTLYEVMASMGVVVLRIRIVDIVIPEKLVLLLNKPAIERATMRADLVAADKRLQVAVKDAEAAKIKGDGEKKYDRARIEAWSTDGEVVDESAVAARLASQQLETYAAAVKDSKSPIIIGAPGQQFDGASALAGGLSQIGIGLGAKPKTNTEKDKDKRGKKGKAPDEESTGDAETSTEE